ncbi:MAG: hypothetical protein ISS35_09470 [Kiritimatiellae bacterium]|nr:hypothetical protein [Kiritimatiellia bacterium]
MVKHSPNRAQLIHASLLILCCLQPSLRGTPGDSPDATNNAKRLQFPPSQLTTLTGKNLNADNLAESEECATCHEELHKQWLGSGHSIAHTDKIYSAFAELARKEGGETLYVFCSACHIPTAVAAGEVSGHEKKKTTHLFDEGVSCEACHRACDIKPVHHGAGANGSIILDDSDTRYGGIKDPEKSDYHASAYSERHTQATFCSACHTLTHPFNGTIIENSFEEWKNGPYASAGIQCQDCHMRTVAQAKQVARTMTRIRVPGKVTEDSKKRPDSHSHMFVGAGTSTTVGFGENHTKAARERLRSAAAIALNLPKQASAGKELSMQVQITNIGAGHAIPSSITELREVWTEVIVTDQANNTLYHRGAIREDGSVDPKSILYHSVLIDENGKQTYLPWRAVKLAEERLILPKQTVTEIHRLRLPPDASGTLSIKTRLRYRAAPQQIMDQLFGKGTFDIDVIDMTERHDRINIITTASPDQFIKNRNN